jgi:hypothetical protein
MSARGILGVVFIGAVIAVSAACSSGDESSTGDDNITPAKSNKKRGDNADDEGEGTGSPSQSGSPSAPASPSSDPAADGGADATAPTADAAPATQAFTCNQITSATCAQARSAGSIDGDVAGSRVTVKGAGSQWITVRVEESSFSSVPVAVTARLTSPEGAALDVYLYEAGCTKLLASPYGPPEQAEAYAEWPDTAVISNSKTILVEVRHVSGACTPQTEWLLELEGGVVL